MGNLYVSEIKAVDVVSHGDLDFLRLLMSHLSHLHGATFVGAASEVQMEGRSFTAFPSKKANDTEIGSLEVKIGLKHKGFRGSHYESPCI